MTLVGQATVGQSLGIFAVLCVGVPVVAIAARGCLSPLLYALRLIAGLLLLPVVAPLVAYIHHRSAEAAGWGTLKKLQAVGFYSASIVVVWLAAWLVLLGKPAAFLLMLPIAHLPALCYWYKDRTTMTDRFHVFVPKYNIWASDGRSHELYEMRFPPLRFWAQLGCHLTLAAALIADIGPSQLLAVKANVLPVHDLSGPVDAFRDAWSTFWATIVRILLQTPLPGQKQSNNVVGILALVLGIGFVRWIGFLVFTSVVRARGEYARIEAVATAKYIIPSTVTWLLVFGVPGTIINQIQADRRFDTMVFSAIVVWLYLVINWGLRLHAIQRTGNSFASALRHAAIVSGTAIPVWVLCWTGAIAAVVGLFYTPPPLTTTTP